MAPQSWAGEASAEISGMAPSGAGATRWSSPSPRRLSSAAEAEKAARRLFDENKRLEAEREKERGRAPTRRRRRRRRRRSAAARRRRAAAARTPRGRAEARAPSKPPKPNPRRNPNGRRREADVAYQPPAWFTDPNATSTATPPPAPAGADGFRRRSRSRRWRPPARSAPGERADAHGQRQGAPDPVQLGVRSVEARVVVP